MSPILDPNVIPGSIVLVTGVSGFLGSHIADKLLAEGYLVRGTTRNSEKNAWLQELFDKKYGEGIFQFVTIPDPSLAEAYDDHLKGISGIIHAASDMTFGPDPNKVITPMVTGTLNLLKATAKHPRVKRFVLTSSCAAAASPKPGIGSVIDEDTWNEEAIREAWAPAPYEAERGFSVYAASKARAEQEAWGWYRETKPGFILNTVLPTMNMGKSLDSVNQGHPSTSYLVQALFQDDIGPVTHAAQYFFIDVQDCARLYLAALIRQDVKDERIFAYNKPFTWRGMQLVMRKLYPDRSLSNDIAETELDTSTIVHLLRAEALLKDMGQAGWTSMEESVKCNTEDLV